LFCCQLSAHQIEASTIVASRQRWIDELRADLSNMSAVLLRLQMALEKHSLEGQREWIDEMIPATILETKIGLMLNPSHSHHQALFDSITTPLNRL